MRVALPSFLAAVAGVCLGTALTLMGVRLATTRPRPRDLAGMFLAAAGLALTLVALFIAVTATDPSSP